jgi:hypothetical protein
VAMQNCNVVYIIGAQSKESKVFAINAQIKKGKILFDYCAKKEYKCF